MEMLGRILTHPVLLVFVGGGIGCVLRYAINEAFRRSHESFPWHTFAINVVGSFALGIFFGLFRDRVALFYFLGTGVCGGFTTFSTFGLESADLMDQNRWAAAAGYILGSVVAAVTGAYLGVRIIGAR